MVDHLPAASAYGEAIAQDDDLAVERQAEGDAGGDGDSAPSFAEFTPELARLTDLFDVVQAIRAEMWSLAGQKRGPRFRPSERPRGATDRLAVRRAERQADDVVIQLFPGPEGGDPA